MHHHLTLRAKLIIMISVMASMFLVALDQTIVSTSLTKIVEQFNAYSSLSWVVTVYLLTSTITVPIAGKLSDLFGRRLLLVIGVVIFTVGSLLSGSSQDITQLILYRALQGIGGGIITANAFTIVGDLFAARERGRWQGLMGAVFGISSLIGPLLGGYLTESHTIFGLVTSWRWTFFINVPVGIAAFILLLLFCPPLRNDKKPRIDYAGASILTIVLASLVLAVDNTKDIFSGLLSSTHLSLLGLRIIMYGVVAVGIAAFILVERHSKEPVLDLNFFKNKNFIILMTIAAFVGVALLGGILYLTQFNQQVFHASPTQSGLMLLPMVGGLMAVSISSGQIVSRTGKYKRFIIMGFILATLASAALYTLTPSSPYFQEAIIMVFLGAGVGAAMPLMNIAVQNEFSQKELGIATSSSQLFRGLGSTIGTAVFGGLLTLGITTAVGNMNNDPYIQTLKQSPQASSLVANANDGNTLLNLNTPNIKSQISNGFTKSIASVKLPTAAKAQLTKQFEQKQSNFSTKIVDAFSSSLHTIFIVMSIMMLVALVLTFFLTERPLRTAKADETPGEEAIAA